MGPGVARGPAATSPRAVARDETGQAGCASAYLNFILQSTRATSTRQDAGDRHRVVVTHRCDGSRILAGPAVTPGALTTMERARHAGPICGAAVASLGARWRAVETVGGWRLIVAATLYRREVNGRVLAGARRGPTGSRPMSRWCAVATMSACAGQAHTRPACALVGARRVTGLSTTHLMEMLSSALPRTAQLALLFFDLDNFKRSTTCWAMPPVTKSCALRQLSAGGAQDRRRRGSAATSFVLGSRSGE